MVDTLKNTGTFDAGGLVDNSGKVTVESGSVIDNTGTASLSGNVVHRPGEYYPNPDDNMGTATLAGVTTLDHNSAVEIASAGEKPVTTRLAQIEAAIARLGVFAEEHHSAVGVLATVVGQLVGVPSLGATADRVTVDIGRVLHELGTIATEGSAGSLVDVQKTGVVVRPSFIGQMSDDILAFRKMVHGW